MKLSNDLIVALRSEQRKGPGGRGGTGSGLTLKQLAAKYGLTYRNVRAILDGETHVR